MAKVTFNIPSRTIKEGPQAFRVPDRLVTTMIRGWYNYAQRAIPQIPNIPEQMGKGRSNSPEKDWFLVDTIVSDKWITFMLQRESTGERGTVTILRKDSL